MDVWWWRLRTPAGSIRRRKQMAPERKLACVKVTLGSTAAASPPDVRRGSAPPFNSRLRMGCAPGSGFAPKFNGPKAEPGAQPKTSVNVDGEAEPRLTSGGEAGMDEVKFSIGS